MRRNHVHDSPYPSHMTTPSLIQIPFRHAVHVVKILVHSVTLIVSPTEIPLYSFFSETVNVTIATRASKADGCPLATSSATCAV